jgi:TPR repeat protein
MISNVTNGELVFDSHRAAHGDKLAADQGTAEAQFRYGLCLEKGIGVPID